MNTAVSDSEIPPLSGKVMKSRKNYHCEHCGGLIILGTRYRRDVHEVRSSIDKGTLRNRHFHLDCGQPWWVAGDTFYFRNLGRLSARPSTEESTLTTMSLRVSINGEVLTVPLPQSVQAKLAATASTVKREAALLELKLTFETFFVTLAAAAGNPKKSRRASTAFEAFLAVQP